MNDGEPDARLRYTTDGGETWTPMPPGDWTVAEMACTVCGKEWVATYPSEAPALECPECGYMVPAPEAKPEGGA